MGKFTYGHWSPVRPMFKFHLCLGLPYMPVTSCLAFPKLSYFICKMKTIFTVKNYYAIKWDKISKCVGCCQPYNGPLVNIVFFLVMSKLRSELHMKAQILLSGQMIICVVEKFFVIFSHFCILSWVFGDKNALSTTPWVLFEGFTKYFLILLKLLFKASFK